MLTRVIGDTDACFTVNGHDAQSMSMFMGGWRQGKRTFAFQFHAAQIQVFLSNLRLRDGWSRVIIAWVRDTYLASIQLVVSPTSFWIIGIAESHQPFGLLKEWIHPDSLR
jgi:hypothetical protein